VRSAEWEGVQVRVVDAAAIDHVLTIIRKHLPDPATLRALAEELGGVGEGEQVPLR